VFIFYMITAVVLAALIFVFYLIWKEQDIEDGSLKDSGDPVTAAGLLDRLGLENHQTKKQSWFKRAGQGIGAFFQSLIPSKKPAVSLSPEHPREPQSTQSGSASLRLDNVITDNVDKNVELSVKIDELQAVITDLTEKIRKSEQFITEKNNTIDKITKELDYERKHRKEFNKVKDLLEKELKDVKDSAKQVQIELAASKTENQTHQNRIEQLREKIQQLETLCLQKDARISELSRTPAQQPFRAEPSESPTQNNGQTGESNESFEQQPSTTASESQPERPQINSKPAADSAQSPQEMMTDSQEQSSDNSPASLNLDPVSNLEKNYEQDAAPLEKAPLSEIPKNDKENSLTTTKIPEDNQDSAGVHQNPPTIHENTDTLGMDPKLYSSNDNESLNESPISEPAETQPEELSSLKQEEDNALQQHDESLIEETPEKRADSEKVHLSPDIFKDIEEQFRQIEKELQSTQEDETVNTTDEDEEESQK